MKEPENVLIVGPSGCGKTKKLLEILKTEKMGVFDFVIILCIPKTHPMIMVFHLK